ncbi:hypothetical protein L6R52_36365 [Myxococcota bacterium]|nr:hypothetical protein [Myxococcota bacterium]
MAEVYFLTVSTVKKIVDPVVTFTTADANGVIRYFDVDMTDPLLASPMWSEPKPLTLGAAKLALTEKFLNLNNISKKGKVKVPDNLPLLDVPKYRAVRVDAAKVTVVGTSPDADDPAAAPEATIELFDVAEARQGQWLYLAPDGRLTLLVSEDTCANLGITGQVPPGSVSEKLAALAAEAEGTSAVSTTDERAFTLGALALSLTKTSS